MNNGYLVFIKRTRYYINIAIKNLKFPGVRLLLLFVVLTLLECAVGEFTSLYKAFISIKGRGSERRMESKRIQVENKSSRSSRLIFMKPTKFFYFFIYLNIQ